MRWRAEPDQGFLFNEGHACLIHDGNLFLTFSGSTTDERYAMVLWRLGADGEPAFTDER